MRRGDFKRSDIFAATFHEKRVCGRGELNPHGLAATGSAPARHQRVIKGDSLCPYLLCGLASNSASERAAAAFSCLCFVCRPTVVKRCWLAV